MPLGASTPADRTRLPRRPDGLKTRPWYRGLAASKVGRALYKRFVVNPTVTHAIMRSLRGLRLMNERMFRFLMGQTDSRAKRQLVHDVWLSYRLIEPDLASVAANAQKLMASRSISSSARTTG